MSQDKSASKAKQYRLLTVAYAVLVLLIAAGFLRVESIQYELKLESERRANLLCELGNERQEILLDILHQVYKEPLASDVDEEKAQARAEFLDEVDRTLASTECPPNPDDLRDTLDD